MSVRTISFSSDQVYHVYNRGNSKQLIFLDVQDYNYFLRVLFIGNSQKGVKNVRRTADLYSYPRGDLIVAIGAYCLMPNHFHLLLRAKDEYSIPKFMKKICTSYAMYFNKKYKRTGTLFEGRYKATHVTDDVYFQYLFAYIHLNPAKLIDSSWKENMKVDPQVLYDYVENYPYSSYQDYLFPDKRRQSATLEKETFPFVFDGDDPRKSINSWFNRGGSDLLS